MSKKKKKYRLPHNIQELLEDLEIPELSEDLLKTYQDKHNKGKSKLQQIKNGSMKNLQAIKNKMKKTQQSKLNRLRGK